jgi:SAM-dependent methyltransferase
MAFYNLAFGSGGYPRDRWEFDQTLDALTPIALACSRPLKLLEAGAGVGSFLEGIRQRPALRERIAAEAIEYDDVALHTLTQRGFAANAGSITDLVQDPDQGGRFDIICMFQTLEHMAGVTDVFQAFAFLLRPEGHVFLSVPNGPSVDYQEKVVQLWDMPPNHVGRWSLGCLDIAAKRNGLEVVAAAVEPQWTRFRHAWHYATYRLASRAYFAGSWEHRINAVRSRYLRWALKGLTGILWVPRFWFKQQATGHNLWVHIRRSSETFPE